MAKARVQKTPSGKVATQLGDRVLVGPSGEAFTIVELAKLTGASIPVIEKAVKYLQTSEPLSVQILNSRGENDEHTFRFRVTNNTTHGIYLESLAIDRPNGVNVWARAAKASGLGSDHTKRGLEAFPFFVPANESRELELGFPIQDQASPNFANNPNAILVFELGMLDYQKHFDRGKKPRKVSVEVLLRWR